MVSLNLGLRVFAAIEIIGVVLWATLLFLMSGMDHSADGGATIRLAGLACIAFAALGWMLVMLVRIRQVRWAEGCLAIWCVVPVIFLILMSDNREFPPGWGI
jgi:hypothetical protein